MPDVRTPEPRDEQVQTASDSAPVPAIGVLLPVRLETRFYPPDGSGSWTLRLRVIPDRVSLDVHDPLASEDELASIEQFWQEAGGDVHSDAAAKAWPSLVARHGGPRAGWLARTFPPQIDPGGSIAVVHPAQVREQPLTSRLRGFPDHLEVWLGRGGTSPQMVAELTVDPDLLDFSLPSFEAQDEERWWTSFASAREAGLAAEIDLGPATPDDIDVLFVIGLGDDPPDDLFQAHVDTGLLDLIAPGSPTNTIHGKPATNLAEEAGIWLDLLRGEIVQPGADQISEALTGTAGQLGAIPGGDVTARDLNQALVRALWPALWGHPWRDPLGLGSGVQEAGPWAGDNLLPEGPLPAVRIGNVPYGLLPTTALADWQPEVTDLWLEEALRPHLLRLRRDWATAAEEHGTAAGADTRKLLDLLGRTASSTRYAWSSMTSLEESSGINLAGGFRLPYPLARAFWKSLAAVPLSYPINPQRHWLASGWPQDLAIPLVVPDNLPAGLSFGDVLQMIQAAHPGDLANGTFVANELNRERPNSLLIRLLIFAKIFAAVDATRYSSEIIGPVMDPLSLPDSVTGLQRDAENFRDSGSSSAPYQIYERLQQALAFLADTPPEEIERGLRAVLDTAIYRIDPWITAYAWRRLRSLIERDYPLRLGIYGWVDRPAPGSPGPTPGGLLHAPSTTQAYTAIILRDKAIHDPEENRWRMDLTSSAIRAAAQIGDEVRLGRHLHVVLGQEVERVVGDPELIKRLRKQYPLRVEHDGRRVCDGKAVLDAPTGDLQTLGLASHHLAALDPLRRALDAYGDLLVAEGVFHVVSGRSDMAGAAMDAAAGLATPPELEVLQTPRSGRSASTTVVFCLSGATATTAPSLSSSPTALADPSLVRWLYYRTATLAGSVAAAFNWQVVQRSGETTGTVTVTLDDVGLRVYDIAVLTPGLLHQLVLAQVEGGIEILPGSAGDLSHAKILEMITMIGGRPALPEDLVVGEAALAADALLEDLRTRLANVQAAANALIDYMKGAMSGSDNTQRAALRNAARWGIVPQESAHRSLKEQVQDALDSLTRRLDAAPDAASAMGMDADELATAMAELVAPDGRFPVLSLIDFSQLPTQFAKDSRPSPSSLNNLDGAWLSVNAVVRPALARLEAHQMASLLDDEEPPLYCWSNRPGDPWQLNAPPDPNTGFAPDTELIMAYGPNFVLDGANKTIAVCVVDTWSEVVPASDQVTTAAFGFDAPSARAPQAILLAVPPRTGEGLDGAALARIVAETRELAHARMAIPKDLGVYASLVPPVLLPGSGNTGVYMTPSGRKVL